MKKDTILGRQEILSNFWNIKSRYRNYRRKIHTVKLKVISVAIQDQNKQKQEIGKALGRESK